MATSRFGLVIGTCAASLVHVWSVRQKVSTEIGSAALAEAIGSLLQQQSSGTEELLDRISEFADAAVTPGAAQSYDTILKGVVQHIESETEHSIKTAQSKSQKKFDVLFKGLEGANTLANTAKATADDHDKSWFECVDEEQAKRHATEAAQKTLATSVNSEEEACRLQQDNEGFAHDATEKYTLDFTCDFMDKTCQAALQDFNSTTIEKMRQDARGALQKAQATYTSLKASCDAKKQERVQAQSALDAAELAWSSQKSLCKKVAVTRKAALCAFGVAAQAKCTAEKVYKSSEAASKRRGGIFDGIFSEADRKDEWKASQTAKCMMEQSIKKSLNSVFDKADMAACAAKVNFDEHVGSLNLRQSEVAKLVSANKCAASAISFHNSLTWTKPAAERALSSDYKKKPWTPALDPSAGNFQFCSLTAIWGAMTKWR